MKSMIMIVICLFITSCYNDSPINSYDDTWKSSRKNDVNFTDTARQLDTSHVHLPVVNKYSYIFNSNDSDVCKRMSDSVFLIRLDDRQFQTFMKLNIITNNAIANYINWTWSSKDTLFIIIYQYNSGPLSPINPCSVIVNGTASAMLGFHSVNYKDTVRISAEFIDSKIVKHVLFRKNLYFILN